VAATPTTRRQGGDRGAPAAFSVLAERFDVEVMDVPSDVARIRLGVEAGGEWDAVIRRGELRIEPADYEAEPDATIAADSKSWEQLATDVRGGMDAFRRGKLRVRHNLHLGIGFLAATSGVTGPGRLRFDAIGTTSGTFSILSAGEGAPILCIHGLGGTKASFMPTVRGLADRHRVIAADLPGFGESDKPITAPYDAPYFARAVIDLLDALRIERAHRVGNVVLLSPALAWLRDRQLKWLLPPMLPKLGLLQPTPRAITEPLVRRFVPGGQDGWAAAGVDEFLRAFLQPRGRAAFYSALRNIYVDEPHGEDGLWTRLAEMAPETMFIWGRHDQLIPIAFMKHVERTLPAARHLELNCGHVPQIEMPTQTNAAIREFLS
jgi:pimeloyl-ACP methyl ester carboxylesterase